MIRAIFVDIGGTLRDSNRKRLMKLHYQMMKMVLQYF